MKHLFNTKETVKYIIIGIIVTAVNWGTYTFGVNYINLPILLSNIMAFIIATIVSFIGNTFWTFNSDKNNIIHKFISFVSIRVGTGIILENITLMGLVYVGLTQTFIHIPAFWAKLIAVITSTLLNYILYKKYLKKF